DQRPDHAARRCADFDHARDLGAARHLAEAAAVLARAAAGAVDRLAVVDRDLDRNRRPLLQPDDQRRRHSEAVPQRWRTLRTARLSYLPAAVPDLPGHLRASGGRALCARYAARAALRRRTRLDPFSNRLGRADLALSRTRGNQVAALRAAGLSGDYAALR